MGAEILWAWDATNSVFRKVLVDATGTLQVGGLSMKLADLTDVNLAGLTNGDLIYYDSATVTWKRIAHKDATTGVHGVGAGIVAQIADIGVAANLPANIKICGIEFNIDGGGVAIATGLKMGLEIPFACTITRATLLGVLPASTNGSIVVDIWKDTYANHPPTVAKNICSATPPTIVTAQKAQDSTLTGWTTAITAGDILFINVNSCTTFTAVVLSLRVSKT